MHYNYYKDYIKYKGSECWMHYIGWFRGVHVFHSNKKLDINEKIKYENNVYKIIDVEKIIDQRKNIYYKVRCHII